MKRIRPLAVLLLVALAGPLTGAAAGATAQDSVTVTVAVVDGGGNPIPNVDLRATWDGGSAEATTKSNGKALIDVPRGANVEMRIDHVAYTRNSPYQLMDATEEEVTVTVARKASATLTVVDSNGPVEDARVRLRKGSSLVVGGPTDAGGEFSTGVIEAGIYTVTVSKAGYLSNTMRLDIGRETSQELRIEHGSVTVTFRVVDRNFDPPKPVSGATITGAEIGSVKTQSNGVQQVSLPVNSKIPVTVEKEGYGTVNKTVTTDESDVTVNISTRKDAAISIDLLNERVVTGERVRVAVTDQYGNPMPEANVYRNGVTVGTTSSDGVVVVSIDEAGEHTIHAESGRLSSDRVSVEGVRPAPDSTPTPIRMTASGTGDDGSTAGPAAESDLSGVIAVPGLGERIHLRSIGIGVVLGIILTLVLFARLRRGG